MVLLLTVIIEPSDPLFVHFDRRFPHKSTLDSVSRYEGGQDMVKRREMSLEDIELYQERMEIVARRIQITSIIAYEMHTI
jgi:hypothetical protein